MVRELSASARSLSLSFFPPSAGVATERGFPPCVSRVALCRREALSGRRKERGRFSSPAEATKTDCGGGSGRQRNKLASPLAPSFPRLSAVRTWRLEQLLFSVRRTRKRRSVQARSVLKCFFFFGKEESHA